MTSKFYQRKSDQKILILYRRISNGVILTDFDKESGIPICNDCYQIFVSKEGLKENYTLVDYVVPLQENKDIQDAIVRIFKSLMIRMQDLGVLEDSIELAISVEDDCSILKQIFFENLREDGIKDVIRLHFPEDVVEDILFSGALDVFSDLLLPLTNNVRELTNKCGGNSTKDLQGENPK